MSTNFSSLIPKNQPGLSQLNPMKSHEITVFAGNITMIIILLSVFLCFFYGFPMVFL